MFKVDIVVTNPDGKVASGSFQFTFEDAAPTITSITPVSGVSGDIVTVVGTGFKEGITVMFGLVPATDVVVAADGNSLTCKVPQV